MKASITLLTSLILLAFSGSLAVSQAVLPEKPWQHMAAAVSDLRWVSVLDPFIENEEKLVWYSHAQSPRFGGMWMGELEIWNTTEEPRSFLPYTIKMTSGYFEWVAIYEGFVRVRVPRQILVDRDMRGRELTRIFDNYEVLYPILRIPNFVTLRPGQSVKLNIVATAHRQYQFGRLQPSYPVELNLLTITDGQRRTLIDITGPGFAAPTNFDGARAIMEAADRAVKGIKVPAMNDPAWAHVPLRPDGNPSLDAAYGGRIGTLAR